MSGIAKLFPSPAKVINKAGEISLDSLSGKIVFLYFSASWCPPCRGFTPVLCEFYEKYHKTKNFEVIFISWDEEEEKHNAYYGKMPWAQLTFKNRETMDNLRIMFNVQSIPYLIGINADSGDIITKSARAKLVQDPEGRSFPWPDS